MRRSARRNRVRGTTRQALRRGSVPARSGGARCASLRARAGDDAGSRGDGRVWRLLRCRGLGRPHVVDLLDEARWDRAVIVVEFLEGAVKEVALEIVLNGART